MIKVLNFRFVCKKFRVSLAINLPIILDINTGIKKVYRRIKDFFVKPRTYKMLLKFGCSKFIDKYGRKDFQRLVRKGIK